MVPFTIIIPARYNSTRLPGKPLLDLAGKPMIQRVYEQSRLSEAARVVVATDDERIKLCVERFGGEVCMTSAGHESGTDRLAEVATTLGLDEESLVVNVQGDEPLIPPTVINQVATNLAGSGADMSTLSEPLKTEEHVFDPNAVKVVSDKNGIAMYFSRAPIPWNRDTYSSAGGDLPQLLSVQRHIGIYGYRVGFLHRFVTWGACALEQVESLEQLRAMWHGARIHVEQAIESPPPGIDTESDLQSVRELLEGL